MKFLLLLTLLTTTFARPTKNVPLVLKLQQEIPQLPYSRIASNAAIDNIVAFGDSLSDNGNGTYRFLNGSRPSINGYWNGRWSDGLVWAEYLANQWNATLDDRAYGSSTSDNDFVPGFVQNVDNTNYSIPGLAQQVDQFIQENNIQAMANRTLFTLWSGHNDFLTTVDNGSFSDVLSVLGSDFRKTLAKGIANNAQRLIDAGAQNVVVLQLAPVSETPSAQDYNFVLKSALKEIIKETNEDLADEMKKVSGALLFRTTKAFNEIIDNPDRYNITVTDRACLENYADYTSYPFNNNATAVVCEEPNKALFWDYVHPTTVGHFQLASLLSSWLAQTLPSVQNNSSDDDDDDDDDDDSSSGYFGWLGNLF